MSPGRLRPMAAAVLRHLPPDVGAVAVRDAGRTLVGVAPDRQLVETGPAVFRSLDGLERGWWAGFLAYELGRSVERVVPRDAHREALPDVVLGRFPAQLVLDPRTRTWEIRGEGPARALLDRAVTAAVSRPPVEVVPAPTRWESGLARPEYEARVDEILRLIRAGDCYQVNLTRRLTCEEDLDPVALFATIEAHHPAPHAAFVRLGEVAVVSASPERFLAWRGVDIETRPVKGTDADRDRLRASLKDRAENVMIVDMARNDLGRVCRPGTIRVPSLCALEAHPGLHHLVSSVRGRLGREVGVGARLRATFPPASITGAPKPRVMQIIEDLEPVPRGVYCGSIGWIDTERHTADLSVAIRTFTIAGERTHLGVGGGVVADSDPAREWGETELKATRLLALAGNRPSSDALAARATR